MAAHAVDDDQQCGCSLRRDGDAVLVVFAVTDQTQICILDLQARAPARACQLLHFDATDRPAQRFISSRAHAV